jgi:hypothetical protein
LACLTVGLPVFAVGLNTGLAWLTWIGVVALEVGVASFVRQAYVFYRARVRRRIEIGMRFAAAAVVFLAVASALGPVVLWRGTGATRLATTYALTGLLGGVVLYVVGFFYKIVPMLAWTARQRKQMSRPDVPALRVDEMYSQRVAAAQLAALVLGLVTLALSVLGGAPSAAFAGAALFLVGVLLFVSQIVRIGLAASGPVERRVFHDAPGAVLSHGEPEPVKLVHSVVGIAAGVQRFDHDGVPDKDRAGKREYR